MIRAFKDIKDENALDVLAEVIEPISSICTDEKIKDYFEKPMALLASYMIKNHKKEVMQILQAMSGEEYHCNLATLTVDLITLVSDETVQSLFKSSVQSGEQSLELNASGSATENTEGTEAK